MTDNTHQPSSGFNVEDYNTYVLFEHLNRGCIPNDLDELLLRCGKRKPYLKAIIESYERTSDRGKAIENLRQIIAGSPDYQRIINDVSLRERAIASGDVLSPVPSATPSADVTETTTEGIQETDPSGDGLTDEVVFDMDLNADALAQPHAEAAFACLDADSSGDGVPAGFTSEADLAAFWVDQQVDVSSFQTHGEGNSTEDREPVAGDGSSEHTPAPTITTPRRKNVVNMPNLDVFTLDELLEMKLDPPAWLIEGVIPEGSTLFAGPSKAGKSMLAQYISLCICTGLPAFGTTPVKQGRVLYLTLEGGAAGLQFRMQNMVNNMKAFGMPRPLDFKRSWGTLRTDALHTLQHELETWPDLRLVVIDTFQLIRGEAGGKNAYESDYRDISSLSRLFNEYGVSVMMLHHLNKRNNSEEQDIMNLINGSNGLGAGVDNIMIMQRPRGTVDVELSLIAREHEESVKKLRYNKDTFLWDLAGEVEPEAKTPERQTVLDVLRGSEGPMSPSGIAEVAGISVTNVQKLLVGLLKEGLVCKTGYGRYQAVKDDGLSIEQGRPSDDALGSDEEC